MPRKILFIVNPHSGTSIKPINEEVIRSHFDHPNWSIESTKYAGHARDIAARAKDHVDAIIAIGGDGTVNEVVSAIVDSSVVLGIIPKGSGNGLSNFLGIPKDLTGALNLIKAGEVLAIDSMSLNEHRFVNMAGIGFDAHIAHIFKDFGSREFFSYSKLVVNEFRKYPGIRVKLRYNGNDTREESVFVLSFANSSQYGNNAHIAPAAVIDDGLTDVCIVRKFPLISSLAIVYKLFNKSLIDSSYYSSFKVQEIHVTSDTEMYAHVDGEPIVVGKEALLTVHSRNLKVLVP